MQNVTDFLLYCGLIQQTFPSLIKLQVTGLKLVISFNKKILPKYNFVNIQ